MTRIFNHLTSDICVIFNDGCKCPYFVNIASKGEGSVDCQYVKPGTNITITIDGDIFQQYTLIKYNKEIHIGQITSRWVGADQDSTIIPANAQQGRPYIRVHNFTDQELNLNEQFIIPPRSTRHFKGRDHLGVRLGTVFVDNQGNFEKWKMLTPITDVYFGVVSEFKQPSYGGWQMDEVFNENFNEPQFLLQEGFLSGPGCGLIDYNKLPPVEGCFNENVDDWGLPL